MLGEATALAADSYRIAPKRLQEKYGFTFKFTDLPAALADLFDKTDAAKQGIAS